MKLEYIVLTGVFFNIMMSLIFPTVLMPDEVQESLNVSQVEYDFSGQSILTNDNKDNIDNIYQTVSNEEELKALANAQASQTTIIGQIASFFDSALDAIKKASQYFSFIIPFSKILFLLPGALGFFVGTMYSVVIAIAIIRLIRS